MEDKTIIRLYHRNLIKYWKNTPKFRIGDFVRVKKDADTIFGKGYIVAGFDSCRQKVVGKIGIIQGIDEVLTTPDEEPKRYSIDYLVNFGKNKIVMMEEWLTKYK